MNRHIVRILTKGLMVATVIGSLSGPAIAQVDQNRPGSPAPVSARDDRPNWGLLGLLGLAGLAGLTRRADTRDYRGDRTTTASRL
jgi:MYXO-CTERM domain-containing protein